MDYWGACCPLTGITEPGLLRASHIVPWLGFGRLRQAFSLDAKACEWGVGQADGKLVGAIERGWSWLKVPR
jgi:hypothetical protein